MTQKHLNPRGREDLASQDVSDYSISGVLKALHPCSAVVVDRIPVLFRHWSDSDKLGGTVFRFNDCELNLAFELRARKFLLYSLQV